MSKLLRNLLGATALTVAGMAAAAQANAALVIQYRYDGGALTPLFSTPGDVIAVPGGTIGDFRFGFSAVSTADSTPQMAMLLGTTINIINTGSAAHTLQLLISDDDFVLPTAPASLFSGVGGTVGTASAANALSFSSSAGATSAATLTPSVTNVGTFDANNTTFVASLPSPYTLSQDITITLGAGVSASGTTRTQLTAVPEPTSLALLGAGLAGLGLVQRRRRKAQAANAVR